MKPISSVIFSKPTPTCTAVSILILLTVAVFTLRRPYPSYSQNALGFRLAFLSSSTNATVSSYLRSLTSHPHLAGTQPSLATARLVESHFQSLGLETQTAGFSSLLSYPIHASLVAQFPNGTAINVPLTEPGSSGRGIVPPYHAYSPSGFVRSTPVFAYYGRDEDYRRLVELGVNVSGHVVMVRTGNQLSRGGQVRAAERAGAAAVLIYSEVIKGGGGGVERGTVMKGVGDPTTPGWAVGADGDGEVLEVDDAQVLRRFPKIPSLPLSMDAAQLVLGSLGGASVPLEWKESLMSKVGGVGPGPVVLNFTYLGENKMVTIHNVFGIIRGSEEPDRYVLLGNHRDAWTYGAVDPNSGTAALLDIARRYSLLIRMGWNPRRTLILCSWDAEEFGMVGSTEWVEQNIMNLGSKAVAYLNVDCAAQGPGLFASATPQLDDLLVEVTKKVRDPDSEDATVFEMWTKANNGINIQRLSGVDSDFAPFIQHAGVPSVDIYFGKDFPVYHTAFDTYEWMKSYGDPTFQRHVAAAGIWGLLALHLADDLILPFNYRTYAKQLQMEVDNEGYSERSRCVSKFLMEYVDVLSKVLSDEEISKSISIHPLTSAVEMLHSVAEEIQIEAKKLREEEEPIGDVKKVFRLRSLNDRLMLAERGFLDEDGLPGNRWFKHLIFGPSDDPRSKLGFFPGIADAIAQTKLVIVNARQEQAAAAIQHQIWRAARGIQRAADALRGHVFLLS